MTRLEFINNFMDHIADSLRYNETFHLNISNQLFDKKHDFKKLVNTFTNFFECELVESCNGNYFIISCEVNSFPYVLLVTIVDSDDDIIVIYASLFSSVDTAKKSKIFSELDNSEGNYEKYFKY